MAVAGVGTVRLRSKTTLGGDAHAPNKHARVRLHTHAHTLTHTHTHERERERESRNEGRPTGPAARHRLASAPTDSAAIVVTRTQSLNEKKTVKNAARPASS